MKHSFSLLALTIVLRIDAQTNTMDVLFTVDDDSVYISEFLKVHNKNLHLVQDETQKDVDEYLALFANYKLF